MQEFTIQSAKRELDELRKRVSTLEEKVEELTDPEKMRRTLLAYGLIEPSAEDE